MVILFVGFGLSVTRAIFPSLFSSQPPVEPEPQTVKLVVAAVTDIQWKIPESYPIDLPDPMERFIEKPKPEPTPQPQLDPQSQNDPQRVPQIDPEPAPQPDPSPKDLIVIKGILYSDDSPSVIIGQEILSEGDLVGGAIIIKINRDHVIFEWRGQTWSGQLE